MKQKLISENQATRTVGLFDRIKILEQQAAHALNTHQVEGYQATIKMLAETIHFAIGLEPRPELYLQLAQALLVQKNYQRSIDILSELDRLPIKSIVTHDMANQLMLFINYCKGMDVDRLRNISIDGKMMSSVEIRDAMIFGYHILLTGIQEKL